MVRRPQKSGRTAGVSLFLCFLHLTTASARIGSRWSKDYVRMCTIFTAVHHLRCCADRRPPTIQRGCEHARRAGALEGTANVDGTGTCYGIRTLCRVGNALRG